MSRKAFAPLSGQIAAVLEDMSARDTRVVERFLTVVIAATQQAQEQVQRVDGASTGR